MNNNDLRFDPLTGQLITGNNNTNNLNTDNAAAQNNGAQINPATIGGMQVDNNTNFGPTANPTNVNNSAVNTGTITSINNEQSTITNVQPDNMANQMSGIPTVEQSKQDFISSTQIISSDKNEDKKDGPNFILIAIIFVLILAAIIFVFPFLLKNI